MKRLILLILAMLLLCGCGKVTEKPAPTAPGSGFAAPGTTTMPGGENAPAAPQAPAVVHDGNYRRVDIDANNWAQYFELKEIPLYAVSPDEGIGRICQNYCVVLREEYQPYLKPTGNYHVDFLIRFDLYIDTLDIDVEQRIYRHSDDLFYAVQADKRAVFDRNALPGYAYGGLSTDYDGYANAFFTGYAMLLPDYPDQKIWTGFYIDLSKAQAVEASGYLELAG